MARKQTQTADELFDCCVAFGFTDPDTGAPRVVKAGERVRSSDSAYRQAPEFFSQAGAAHADRPTISDFVPDVGPEHPGGAVDYSPGTTWPRD
jgi:hypothetical protein